MMQCGMFVPAKSFHANVCTDLFTHYRREEDATMTSGKFDEELSRMSPVGADAAHIGSQVDDDYILVIDVFERIGI